MVIAFFAIAFSFVNYVASGNNIKRKFCINIKLCSVIILLFLIPIIIINFLRFISEKRYISALNFKSHIDYIRMNDEMDKISNFIYPVDVNNMPVDFYRGVGYFERKDYQSALHYFRNALNMTPGIPVIKNNLASTYYMTGNIDSAKMLLFDLKHKCPDYIEPQINLLSIYTNIKNYDSAKTIINEIDNKKFKSENVKNYYIYKEIINYLK